MTSVTIPNSVTSIYSYAFYNCAGLKRLVIGESVTLIGTEAFRKCNNLKHIYSYPNPDDVILLYSFEDYFDGYGQWCTDTVDVFRGVPKFSCVLHVKPQYNAQYHEARTWKDFYNIVGDLEELATLGDVNNDGKVNVSDVTDLINMIMGITAVDESRADVNADGRVNVSDITALINIILGIS